MGEKREQWQSDVGLILGIMYLTNTANKRQATSALLGIFFA
jgi:hypothetical protein